ncbi:tRNA (Guanine37-N(1)-) methyltransferase [Thermomonospora echinospora]|uniref:tRNA (guanine-N(1)-)-methyltransferase n=1 Tax=Thermomonospora echinospora TaxID=1992 RepID=A0A1H6DPC4_9ACTN|nr:tRNA (guanosine(37)-N1)-methyltransferase TrmD [Thermomonospora echinospora]SEG87034.1 tRNA (Guanine37-N(1)-) methyltransferase [Thermomonospora echinospora]
MRLDIISIFPEYFAPLQVSLLGKARLRGLLDVHVHDLRQWTHDRHRTVDDTPYGGGPGMVMKPDPWGEALDTIAPPPSVPATGARSIPAGQATDAQTVDVQTVDVQAIAHEQAAGAEHGATEGRRPPVPRLIVPTPSGRPFTQAMAVELAAEPWLVFACGRYEGIDSRVVEEARTRMRVDEVSIGDYVLAGGEAAVLVIVEAVGRLVPGVLGNAESVADDSFAPGRMQTLLEGPVYTKPPVWRGRAVPDVLLSGHHGAIARWRRDQALRRTVANRPELAAELDPADLDERDRQVLAEAGLPPGGEAVAGAGLPPGGKAVAD